MNVDTGASFGCRSVKKPSGPRVMFSSRLTASASACGSSATESTTMSTGMRRTVLARVSSARMTSLPSSAGDIAQSLTSATRPRMKCTPSLPTLP